MSTQTKIEKLKTIFNEAPKKVKHLANSLYRNKRNNKPLAEVFALQDLEPHQVTRIEETIHKAFNLYLSNINMLVLRLHTLEDEAA